MKMEKAGVKLLQPFSISETNCKNCFLIVDAKRAEHSAESVVVASGFVLRRDRNDIKQIAVAKLSCVNGRYFILISNRRASRQNRRVALSSSEVDARVI